MPDPLNEALRHTIVTAWSSADAMLRFKQIDPEVLRFSMEADDWQRSRLEYLKQAPMGCGDSAPRLCEILIGDGLRDTPNSGIDISDNARMKQAFLDMQKTLGYFLVRVDVIGKGVGHAYVFLSTNRTSARSPLEGYVYQTNIGPEAQNRFDLIEWVNDKKSSEKVFLPGYLLEIQAQIAGFLVGSDGRRIELNRRAAEIYEQNFLLTGKTLGEADRAKAERAPTSDGGGVVVKISWRPVDAVQAGERMRELRGA